MCEHDGNPNTPCEKVTLETIIEEHLSDEAKKKLAEAELPDELKNVLLADPKVTAIMETVGFNPTQAGEHHTTEFLARLMAFAMEGQVAVATTIMMGGGAGNEVAKYAVGLKEVEAIADKNQARRLQAVFDAS